MFHLIHKRKKNSAEKKTANDSPELLQKKKDLQEKSKSEKDVQEAV